MAVLATEGLLDGIVACLVSHDTNVKQKTLQLLSVLAWVSTEGRTSVLDALHHFSLSRTPPTHNRVAVILDCLKSRRDFDLQMHSMVLVNTLINSCHQLEERVCIRREFLDAGIVDIMNGTCHIHATFTI